MDRFGRLRKGRPFLFGHYAWSRDGRRLAISRATQSSDIVVFRGLKGRQ
jgi:hypothetical protein